ncbi:Alpha/Beta hydrolase protein [Irpex rosettiformis]|uniref:Alpha/Beta hydrolase protein n=1 Tax=Irpex rosettiformis TaxID=378272 RepID=A0ACB8UL95_9APHY|nr:Alpha/Beta hydrolase protein [Irpex rosettiformis]
MPGVWPASLFTDPCDLSKPASEIEPGARCKPSSTPQSSASLNALPELVTDLLKHFEAPGVPPSSRVGDPTLKQRESQPIRLWHLWKHVAFVAWKATGLVSAVVSHTVHGPPRKSWGIEMTIMTAVMRDVHMHTHLADLTMIRMFMSISGLYPVPSNALITPVTFNVRSRNLRGILADFDKVEDGTRELSGEWVVGRKTWERLQAEWQAARRAKLGLEKPRTPQKRKEMVVLYLHGGAYYSSSPATHRLITLPLSKALDARLFALDYRLAPETRFPGPLHDAVSAYFRMTDDLLIPAENIVVAGDSAGGGLALALMMYLRDNNYPLPGAAILMSPWVDLTLSCDSWESNALYDIVPQPVPGDHLNPIACYLGEHMEKYLTHPYASPLFGNFKGLPPMLIQSGEAEVLRDESTLLAHKATRAGVKVRHELFQDAVHVFQTFPFMEQAQQAFHSAREFVRDTLKPINGDASSSATTLESVVEEKLENEINNEKAQVVQGDGSVFSSKKEELYRDSEKRVTEGRVNTVEGSAYSAECRARKGRGEEASEEDEPMIPFSPSSSPSNTPHGHTPSKQSSSTPTTVCRARARSYPKLPDSSSNLSHLKHPPTKDYVIPSPSHSTHPSVTGTAPQPSIRRSHSSHPDITILCEEWASWGPANRTVTFKPDWSSTSNNSFGGVRMKRKKSGSVSSLQGVVVGSGVGGVGGGGMR